MFWMRQLRLAALYVSFGWTNRPLRSRGTFFVDRAGGNVYATARLGRAWLDVDWLR